MMFHGRMLVSSFKSVSRSINMSKNSFNRKLANLPRLPVPALRETMEKYLLTVRPLLSSKQFTETEKVVQKFIGPAGIGHQLHDMLTERAKNHVNWLSDWWLKYTYLEFREPVVAYSSPGLVMPQQSFSSKDDELKFASKIIVASLKFKTLIDNNQLPQEFSGGAPLDMSQYTKIFGTCRIPRVPCDELQLNPDSKHIIIAHKNNFFKVPVYENNGVPLNESHIFMQLKSVTERSQEETFPVGILSSAHRDTWSGAYKRLCDHPENKASVEEIEKSLFLLCLDKNDSSNSTQNYWTRCVLSSIHGGGKDMNSGNRWFDKTIQYQISEDGMAGITYEHTPAEGPPITSLLDFLTKYVKENQSDQYSPSNVEPPKQLKFQLSKETQADIGVASKDLDILIKDLDMKAFIFKPFGKEFIKSQKLSPDSVIQMALQLAFHRLYGHLGATYESASTRLFELGRTETIRSTSLEALKFCEEMKGSQSPTQKAQALRQAVMAHKAYTTAANSGLGVDRLLLGLKRIAIENNMLIPDLYLDSGFTVSSSFRLSTSQVPAKCDAVMGYGPAASDGYGCCYNPHPLSIYFAVSAWNRSPATSAVKFSQAVEQSLVDIHDVLVASQSSKL